MDMSTQETADDVSTDRFGYGAPEATSSDDDEYVACPRLTHTQMTGEAPLVMDDVIAEYDELLKTAGHRHTGVVDAFEAREAWLNAIANVRADEAALDHHADNAERLADEFGWL